MHKSNVFICNLINTLKENKNLSEKEFAKLKNQFSKENGIPNVKNIDLIESYRNLVLQKKIKKNTVLEHLISRRKIRSLSGVSVITCLTKPFPCPGQCIYCPTEPNMPKSYLSNQPAAMRAVLNKFDAFNQVQNRLASLMVTGHEPSKVEIIIIGGTWSFLPKVYQNSYIKNIYNGLNQKIFKKNMRSYGAFVKIPKIDQTENETLSIAMKKNETSVHRCVGLTLETRPDFITIEEIKRFRKFGCTRVEIGVQSLDDKVQEITKRGHNTETVINATKLLKDAGFKITYHLMPGLPGSTVKKDILALKKTFTNSDFLPDWIKIYPCTITKYSELATMYKEKKFSPYTEKELTPILIEMMKIIPRYCRVTRLLRDIPSESIVAGCKTINLRQIVEKEMKTKNIRCEDIRQREIKNDRVDIKNIELRRLNYKASGGDEIFLTYDEKTNDKLISLLRLRIPSQYFSKEKHFIHELEGCALIREVHTYGIHSSVGKNDSNAQHFGFGKKLIKEAERITLKEYKLNKVAVIAGVGVREYYKKFGYVLVGSYMVKELV